MLVVDDESAFQETMARFLESYRRFTAYNGHQALEKLSKHHIDVVLLDLNLPDTNGLRLLQQIRAEHDDVEVIVITSHIELKNAVNCVKEGAFDFLAKSYENYQAIGEHIERALEHRRRRRAAILARADDTLRESMELLERTHSLELAEMIQMVRRVAPTPLTVLIEGESGVGKELLARYVHVHSERATGSFVPVNLAAVPQTLLEATLFGHEKGAFTGADKVRLGKFELAEGGTLFLDEIGELEMPAQVKLLRVLQERQVERIGAAEASPVDVRVVAATNKNLAAEVSAGRFREDLWFRLNVMRITVPPLRQRRRDIPDLVHLLAKRHARSMNREPPRFTREVLRALMDYRWPGNVRELENLIMRMVVLHSDSKVRMEDLPVDYCIDHLIKVTIREADRGRNGERSRLYSLACDLFERYLVKHMVDRCGGNKAEAARKLSVSYATVKNKMAELRESDEDDNGDEDDLDEDLDDGAAGDLTDETMEKEKGPGDVDDEDRPDDDGKKKKKE
ncbi:MAG TPA: sigma-54 dependent transcriptional regulator [Polyangia bacterium]|nr:sigma-54 dependent transcriptional regulator [Polyangia bacterium]